LDEANSLNNKMKKLKLTYCEDKQKRKGSNRKNLFDLVEAAVMKSFP